MNIYELTARQRAILLSFVREQRRTVYKAMLQNIVGDRRHVAPIHYSWDFSNVLGTRMAQLWNCSRGTANHRLQALDGFVLRNPRYGASHANSYKLPKNILEKFGCEADTFWTELGYTKYPEVPAPKHPDEDDELEKHLFRHWILLESLWPESKGEQK